MNWVVVVRGCWSEVEAAEGVLRKAKGAGPVVVGSGGVGAEAGDSSFVGGGEETRDWMRERRAVLRVCSW